MPKNVVRLALVAHTQNNVEVTVIVINHKIKDVRNNNI
jgi:hypothetical protein